MIVYLITNRINGKVYVGKYSGVDPLIRWSAHVRHAQRGAKQHLSNAIRKHGLNAFDIRVLEQCASEEELNALESFHIARLKSNKTGYNMTTGGEGFSKGNTYRTGKKLTPAHKACIARANKGTRKSAATIQRMRIAQSNRKPLSQLSRKRMSDAQKRRLHTKGIPLTDSHRRALKQAKLRVHMDHVHMWMGQ